MFLSPFFQEIAFKKLESYSQGVNQPIRSFYNEVLKLCNEADPSMSDSSKLRLLLNKTNPSVQFEIRLKRPTTTKHLSPDHLHLHNRFSDLVPHNIFNYFLTLASTSIVSSPKVSSRSAEAIQRRNKRCNQLRKLRLAEKQSMFYINRTINPPWTLNHVKTYLQNKHLPFAKISPVRRNQVRIRFNNALTLTATDLSLPTDIFSAGNFSHEFPS
jgi:hypothetical protein